MKKIFAILMVLVFALSVVAGCGSEKAEQTPAKVSASTAATKKDSNKKAEQTERQNKSANIRENGEYTDKDSVAAYINTYKKLPSNFITKKEAEKLGWKKNGTLDKVAPGKSIGGDHFGNFEKQVPSKDGRKWKECDINYKKGNRGKYRIVFSNDGLIYYSDDHYKTFSKLY